MPKLIPKPTIIPIPDEQDKIIAEHIGQINTDTESISIAKMTSPQGWSEPGQRPEFTEYTLVLRGALHVQTETETLVVRASQTIITEPGEWVRYSTPDPGGAEYVAVCVPAFSPEIVHRDQ